MTVPSAKRIFTPGAVHRRVARTSGFSSSLLLRIGALEMLFGESLALERAL